MVRLEPPCHHLRVLYYNKPLPTLQSLFSGKLEISSFFLQIHSKLQKIPRLTAPYYDWVFSHLHPFFAFLKREKQPVFLRSTENHCQQQGAQTLSTTRLKAVWELIPATTYFQGDF